MKHGHQVFGADRLAEHVADLSVSLGLMIKAALASGQAEELVGRRHGASDERGMDLGRTLVHDSRGQRRFVAGRVPVHHR